MGQEEFRDAALVLLGHGSTRNAGAGTPAFQHAAELRRRRCFAEVREAFWKQEPDLARALSGLTAPRVFLVPLFVSEGYFSEEIIPQALGFRIPGQATWTRVQRRGPQTLFYCKPVGTHEHMTGVLLARAREAVAQYPFRRAPEPSEITLFIAGHGTGENEGSRQAIERQAELIRGQGIYADVHAVFLEEAPRIGACYALAQTRHLVVVPFFISDGLHVREDIPVLLGEPERAVRQRLQSGRPTWRNPTEKHGKLVWYASSVGTEPLLADVIIERVREAALWQSPKSEIRSPKQRSGKR